MLAHLSKKLVFKDYFLFSCCGVKSLRQVWPEWQRATAEGKRISRWEHKDSCSDLQPPPSTQKRPPTFLCTDTMFTLQADDMTKLEHVGVSVDDMELNICWPIFIYNINSFY